MRLMRFKKGISLECVDPDLIFWLGVISVEWHLFGWDGAMVVTSVYRSGKGAHGRGEGADMRTKYITPDRVEAFGTFLQAKYGKYLGVVVEPEWLTKKQIKARGGKVTPHLHIQLKGKKRLWFPGSNYMLAPVLAEAI